MTLGIAAAMSAAFANPLGAGPDAGEQAVAAATASWRTGAESRVEMDIQASIDTRGTGMFDDARLYVGFRTCRRSACGDTTWYDTIVARDEFRVSDDFSSAELEASVFGQPLHVVWQHPEDGWTTSDSRVQGYAPLLPYGQVRVFVRDTRSAIATFEWAAVGCLTSSAIIESYVIYDGVVDAAPTGLPQAAPTELDDFFGVAPCEGR